MVSRDSGPRECVKCQVIIGGFLHSYRNMLKKVKKYV